MPEKQMIARIREILDNPDTDYPEKKASILNCLEELDGKVLQDDITQIREILNYPLEFESGTGNCFTLYQYLHYLEELANDSNPGRDQSDGLDQYETVERYYSTERVR